VRYSSREKKKKRLDYWRGALLALLGLTALAGLVVLYLWVRANSDEINEATNCPMDGPRAVHVLLFDRTDPITPQQALQIKQHIDHLADSAITGQRFDLYTVEGNTEQLLKRELQVCSSGSGKNANWLYRNPEIIQERFKTRFIEVLGSKVDELLEASSKPYSPIIESMRAAAIESFGPYEHAKIPLGFTLISDAVQNTPLYSHIRSVPNFKELSRTPSWRSLQPDFRGANVDILYLLRPSAVRAGAPIQNRGHQGFWEDLIPAANGHLISIQLI
jgi:hypothetical protein